MKLRYTLLLACLWLGMSGRVSGQASLVPTTTGTISTYALFQPPFQNGMLATAANLYPLAGIAAAFDAKGGFYLANPDWNCVYRVQADGHIYIAAGSSTRISGNSGDGGPATAAFLTSPNALATDAQGNVFISTGDGIRKINPAGTISTLPISGLDPHYVPFAIGVDAAGNLYIVQDTQVFKYSAAGVLSVAAGNGQAGFSGDGGPATAASFRHISGLAVDSAGNLFISDLPNYRVRKVTADGVVATLAGTGVEGFGGDGGPANQAQLNYPEALSVDSAGNLYIAETLSDVVRKVDTNGVITQFAGGPRAYPGFSGDGGPANGAELNQPRTIAADSAGDVYIADLFNYRVREVTPNGLIQTVAGNGVAPAGVHGFAPTYLAGDTAGNLYVAAVGGDVVYKIGPDRRPTIFAGNGTHGFADGVPALEAEFDGIDGVATDSTGNVYVSDSGNGRVRKISTAGRVTTIAGNGQQGFSGDGGLAVNASLFFPEALAVAPNGTVYFFDYWNNRIRKISPVGIITTVAGNGSSTFSGDGPATTVSVNAGSLVLDAAGDLLISEGARIRKLTADGQITTIAGTGTFGFNGDGPALSTSFNGASSLVLDKANNIYFSDVYNQRIRKLSPDGRITTIAGGQSGYSGDGGPAALAQLWFPSGLVLDPSGVLFIADSDNGVIRSISLQVTAAFSLPPSTYGTAQTAGTASVPASGFADITPYSGSGALSAMAILSFHDGDVLASETTVPGSPSIQNGRIRAEVSNQARTGLAMANPNDTPATVHFFFTDARGDFENSQMTLPPYAHIVAFLDDALFGSIRPIDGTFTFHSSLPMAVTALRGLVNERSEFLMTTLPVVDLDAPPVAGTALIPHFAAGGGWTTQVVLVNPTDYGLSGTIHFTSPAGQPSLSNLAYFIAPRAAETFEVSGSDDAGSVTGSISITPTGGTGTVPAAMAIFSMVKNAITVTAAGVPAVPAAGVPAVPAARHFGLYVEMAGDFGNAAPGSLQTGVAIANPSEEPITIIMSLISNSSGARPDRPLTIPAHGQIAMFLNQIPGLDGVPLPYKGVLDIQSAGQFSVIGIRGRYNERGDFLASTNLAVSEDPPPPASPLFIPDFADSGGFSTEFIIFNANTAGASSGFITFIGDSGQGPVFSTAP